MDVGDEATGELVTSARIYFQQDAGADYDPVTDTPASSGYPYTGGVTAHTFYAFDYQGITVPATTNDVGLVILDQPYQLDTYGSLAAPGTLEQYGTGPKARVTVSGTLIANRAGGVRAAGRRISRLPLRQPVQNDGEALSRRPIRRWRWERQR